MGKGDRTANSISRRCPPRFPSALWGFGSSFPVIVAHASFPRSLEPGAGNLCTFRYAKLLVPVRMRCRVIASFCGGDAGLFGRAATVWQFAMAPA